MRHLSWWRYSVLLKYLESAEPLGKTENYFLGIEKLESELYELADNLRTNSNLASNKYFTPVFGVILRRRLRRPKLWIFHPEVSDLELLQRSLLLQAICETERVVHLVVLEDIQSSVEGDLPTSIGHDVTSMCRSSAVELPCE